MYFKRIVIANRGEIALRIMRTAKKLGIRSIAIYSHLDHESEHVKEADEAFPLKGDSLQSTYLDGEQILSIARKANAEAIHPGYGFLSENAVFAKRCREEEIVFIGPSPEAIDLMGNKINARKFAKSVGVPVLEGIVGDHKTLLVHSEKMKFPLLIKAAAGGGGKGMRIVKEPKEMQQALEATSREAATYFGDGAVLIERYIENPRHIEVQILADQHTNVLHLFERECSIQRRFQKVIEEAPSITLSEEQRTAMGETAVRLAKEMKYSNAGTVEFLVDEDMNYYFLEMNTRIQVEHPVTEMITGIDLVEEQLKIASGRKLGYQQDEIKINGHAIEARIYAEDPQKDFIPSPGEISFYKTPALFPERVRLDAAFHQKAEVLADYDPMIAKLVVWDENRDLAIERLHMTLHEYEIHGIKNNLLYLHTLLNTRAYKENLISTHFCQQYTQELNSLMKKGKEELNPALFYISFALFEWNDVKADHVWQEIGYWRQQGSKFRLVDEKIIDVEMLKEDQFKIEDQIYRLETIQIEKDEIRFEYQGRRYQFYHSKNSEGKSFVSCQGFVYELERWSELQVDLSKLQSKENLKADGKIVSPMPGKLIKLEVVEGQKVHKGDVLAIVEAMKMENNILSPFDAVVQHIHVKEGDQVKNEMQLMLIETSS
jgi:3-methylcrotonyl-CoA carboxylase alpha subunit